MRKSEQSGIQQIIDMETPSKDRYWLSVLTFFGVLFGILHGYAAFFPHSWTWGFHHLTFFNLWIRFLVPAFMFLILIPRIQLLLLNGLKRVIAKIFPFRLFFLFFFFLLVFLLLWSGRERFFFMGDGYYCLRSLKNNPAFHELVLIFPNAPFTGVLLWGIPRLLSASGVGSGLEVSLQHISIFAGLCTLLAVYRITHLLEKKTISQLLLFLFLSTAGTIQLFFGYIETYPVIALGFSLFLWAAVLHLQESASDYILAGAYGVLVCLHLGMLCFFPAFIFLIFRSFRRRQFFSGCFSFILFTAIAAGTLFLCGYFTLPSTQTLSAGITNHLRSIGSIKNGWEAYSMFSPWHFIDVANILLLISPFLPVILLLGILLHTKEFVRGKPKEHSLFSILGVCGIAFVFFMKSDLGMSRDWDLESVFLLGAWAAAGFQLFTFISNPEIKHRMGLMVLVFTLLHTIPWIWVNATAASITRADMLLDEQLAGNLSLANSCENLGVFYREKKQYPEALQYFERSIHYDSTNGRRWTQAAEVHDALGHDQLAIHSYETAIAYGRSTENNFLRLAWKYREQNKKEKGVEILKQGLHAHPRSFIISFNIGLELQKNLNDSKAALSYFLKAVEINPGLTRGYYSLAECFQALNDTLNTKRYWLKYLEQRQRDTNAPIPR